MTKSIRIKNYLYGEIERLAKENKRPLITQLEILLEQALKAEALSKPTASFPDSDPPLTNVPFERPFKPDFKQPATKKGRK